MMYKNADLIESCRAGDRSAQYKVYNLYVKSMFNTAMRITGDDGEASDVVQDAFIQVFTRMDLYRGESSFGYWLKQIVINKAISALRKRKSQLFTSLEEISELSDEYAADSMQDETDDDAAMLLEVERIKTAIDKLPDGYRLVITLYLLEGYDHEEISEILGISQSTSRTQYIRGKNKLLQAIAVN